MLHMYIDTGNMCVCTMLLGPNVWNHFRMLRTGGEWNIHPHIAWSLDIIRL